jgi:hypothetical protein
LDYNYRSPLHDDSKPIAQHLTKVALQKVVASMLDSTDGVSQRQDHGKKSKLDAQSDAPSECSILGSNDAKGVAII